jgi:S1-C subfamily serine protease
MKIPFQYLGYQEGFFIFKNVTDAMLMGNSGGPIISENGNVVGTLKGSSKLENGEEVILVQEIPQISL